MPTRQFLRMEARAGKVLVLPIFPLAGDALKQVYFEVVSGHQLWVR